MTTYAPPAPDAVWTALCDGVPEVGTFVYVLGDGDYDPAVPYKFRPYEGHTLPALGVELSAEEALVRKGGRLVPGDRPYYVLARALWTPALPAEAPAPELTLEAYALGAMRTRNTALAPDLSAAVAALGLVGEAGEVSELVKKAVGHGHTLDRARLAEELGDVLWYLAALCAEYDLSLADVAQGNLDKLRRHYPDGFSSAASLARRTPPAEPVEPAASPEPAPPVEPVWTTLRDDLPPEGAWVRIEGDADFDPNWSYQYVDALYFRPAVGCRHKAAPGARRRDGAIRALWDARWTPADWPFGA